MLLHSMTINNKKKNIPERAEFIHLNWKGLFLNQRKKKPNEIKDVAHRVVWSYMYSCSDTI